MDFPHTMNDMGTTVTFCIAVRTSLFYSTFVLVLVLHFHDENEKYESCQENKIGKRKFLVPD